MMIKKMLGQVGGLSNKIIWGFLLFIILPLAIMGTKFYFSSSEIIEKQVTEASEKQVKYFDDYYLNTVNENLEFFLGLWMDHTDLDAIFQDEKIRNRYQDEWEKGLIGYPEITSIFYGNEKGAMYQVPHSQLPKDFDPRTRLWYKGAIQKKGLYWTNPYKDAATGHFIVSLSHPIQNEKGETTGVIAIDLNLTEIGNMIEEQQIGKNGYMMVLDRSGQVIAGAKEEMIGYSAKDLPWAERVVKGSSGTFIEEIQGETILVSFVTNPHSGWKIIGFTPKSELLEAISPFQNLMIKVLVYTGIWSIFAIIGLLMYLNWMLIKPIKKLMNKMEIVQSGDMSVDAPSSRKDEMGDLLRGFDEMLMGQRDLLIQVIVTAAKLGATAEQTSTISKHSSETANNQAKAMAHFSGSIEEMTESIQEVSNNMDDISKSMENTFFMIQDMGKSASDVAQNAVDSTSAVYDLTQSYKYLEASIELISNHAQVASQQGDFSMAVVEEGKRVLEGTKGEMAKIIETTKNLSDIIKELGQAAEQIGEIVELIDDISEQTNLLSLNASIEAARAGEHGKGFEVVASAIGRLSEKSSESTKDIEKLIKRIQVIVMNAIDANEKSVSRIESGVELVGLTESSFSKIDEAIQDTSRLIQGINLSAEEQAKLSKVIIETANQVNELIMQVSATSEEQLATVDEIIHATELVNGWTKETLENTNLQAANSEELAVTTTELNEMTMDVAAMSEEVERIAMEVSDQAKDLIELTSKFKL